jgi:cytochrome bd-type quinol oxidase subunit 2
MLLSVLADIARWLVLAKFGLKSEQYMHSYYYTDALLTVVLYLLLISLYSRVFGELRFAKHMRLAAVVLLLGTAGFSYAVVAQSDDRLVTSFAYELSQNLYFVGIILTYLLWGAILKLRETRTRLVQMVLSLGLYFSAYAASYALLNVTPEVRVVKYASPLLGCLLPLAWCITIMRYSEESRLAPAQLVAVPR